MTDPVVLHDALSIVAHSPDHRVLTRVPGGVSWPPTVTYRPPEGPVLRAAILDIETTGLDVATDRMIEIGIVSFEYDARGVTRILDVVSELEDPGVPLSSNIMQLTGLTDADLAGRHFDRARIAQALADARFVIAHNAAFDRPFMEAAFTEAVDKPWACSQTQLPWTTDAGQGSARLEYLLMKHGFFYDAHRAETDCRATLHLLAQKAAWDERGRSIFTLLRENAARTGLHVWLVDLPYARKDEAKQMGCAWSDGTKPGTRKAWHKEVATPEEAGAMVDAIAAWYPRVAVMKSPPVLITATSPWERFSQRPSTSAPLTALLALAQGQAIEVPDEETPHRTEQGPVAGP